jgi:hypothetical protein
MAGPTKNTHVCVKIQGKIKEEIKMPKNCKCSSLGCSIKAEKFMMTVKCDKRVASKKCAVAFCKEHLLDKNEIFIKKNTKLIEKC